MSSVLRIEAPLRACRSRPPPIASVSRPLECLLPLRGSSAGWRRETIPPPEGRGGETALPMKKRWRGETALPTKKRWRGEPGGVPQYATALPENVVTRISDKIGLRQGNGAAPSRRV